MSSGDDRFRPPAHDVGQFGGRPMSKRGLVRKITAEFEVMALMKL